MTTNGSKVSLGSDKNIIELDSGDGCTTLSMLKTTELGAAGGAQCRVCFRFFPPLPFPTGVHSLSLSKIKP